MAKFMAFTEASYDYQIHVNAALVRTAYSDPDDPNITFLVFDSEHKVPVRGTVKSVTGALANG